MSYIKISESKLEFFLPLASLFLELCCQFTLVRLALNLSTPWKEKIQACDSLADLKAIACSFDGSDLNMALRLAPAYALSKALLNRATALLAEDARLTSRSIRIASVSPGWYAKDA